jgi:hypothetical protein
MIRLAIHRRGRKPKIVEVDPSPVRFAYTNSDGRAILVHAAPLFSAMAEYFTDERDAILSHLKQLSIPPEAVDVTEIGSDVVLPDLAFYEAWVLRNGKIEIDMARARAIHMNKLRVLRDEKLKALDFEMLRVLEIAPQGEERERRLLDVAERKQLLRDMPTIVDLSHIHTPEDLAAVMPEMLQ